jgi:hypothetical protein
MGTDEAGSALPWVDAIAASFPRYSFVEFHEAELPALVVRHGAIVADDIRDAAPLAFRTHDGDAYTWHAAPFGVEVLLGDDHAGTVVELDAACFSEHLHQLLTATGAVRTERARLARGALEGWQRWEPAIQSLTTGRPIYSESVFETLVDRDGRPLDLHATFQPDDDRDDMRHFLETAGYLHIVGVYTRDEVAQLGAEVEQARAATTLGDPFSWWSINAAGEDLVTRINYLGRYSEPLQAMCDDARLGEFARLTDPALRVCADRIDGPMVFIKHANVVKGNGDLGWHVDDGLGGHPVLCPLVQAGIQLDVANAANGQLMLLAGSHRYSKHWIGWGDEGRLPVVALDTRPGDLTLHFGDTMHSTPAPTAPDAGRRALYYKFALDKTFEWIPPGCHYNDALFRADATGRVASNAATY